ALFGLGKVLQLENAQAKCKCLDIDDETDLGIIVDELKNDLSEYIVAFRKGERFSEVFDELDLGKCSDNNVRVRQNGVYLITGGLGGVGLELARYFASCNKVTLLITSRSLFPPRDQ